MQLSNPRVRQDIMGGEAKGAWKEEEPFNQECSLSYLVVPGTEWRSSGLVASSITH